MVYFVFGIKGVPIPNDLKISRREVDKPSNFTVAGSNVYFASNDSTTGTELWSMPVSVFEFGKISGQVTKDTGEPFPDILVEVFDGSMTKIGEAYTDIFGHYIVTDLIARPDYVARANGTGGYITQTVTAVTVTVPDYTIVDFVLSPGGDISGNITASGHRRWPRTSWPLQPWTKMWRKRPWI